MLKIQSKVTQLRAEVLHFFKDFAVLKRNNLNYQLFSYSCQKHVILFLV